MIWSALIRKDELMLMSIGQALAKPGEHIGGEGGAIPVTRFSFGATTISRAKLAAIVPYTLEIARQSTPQIEQVMRRGLTEAYSLVLDAALLSTAAAVPGVRPAGLLYNLGANTAAGSSAGTGMENLIADLTAMLNTLAAAGLGQRPVLLLNDQNFISTGMLMSPLGQMSFRDELNGGRLMGIEVVHSRNVPANTAILVDAAALATAFDPLEFSISQQASIVLANADTTPPTMAGDTGGATGPGAVGTAGQVLPDGGIKLSGNTGAAAGAANAAQAHSLWQHWEEAIRLVAPTSWQLVRPGAVVQRTAIDWS
jgi:hypothetical protein